jgi:hypothetical protein
MDKWSQLIFLFNPFDGEIDNMDASFIRHKSTAIPGAVNTETKPLANKCCPRLNGCVPGSVRYDNLDTFLDLMAITT